MVKESFYRPPLFWTWELKDPGVPETDYMAPHVCPSMNTVGHQVWEALTPYQCFMKQVPHLEFERWAWQTSSCLSERGKAATSTKEVKAVVGILLASTLGPKKGGINALFEVGHNGLYPGFNIQWFGMLRS